MVPGIRTEGRRRQRGKSCTSHWCLPSAHVIPSFRHGWISVPPTDSPDAQSSSSDPFSQSFSPSHRHDNDTHLLVDPPQSNFSGGHVCMPAGMSIKEIISSAFNGRSHQKSISKAPLELISLVPQTHLILHHSSQLILPSQPPLKRHAERSWNTAKAQSAIKKKPPLPRLPANLFSLA